MKKRLSDDEMMRGLGEMRIYFRQKKLFRMNDVLEQLVVDNVTMYNQLNPTEGENNEERSSEERSDESTGGDGR